MAHEKELFIDSFIEEALAGRANFSEDIIDQVATDVKDAFKQQLTSGPRGDFRLRMSNIGRPKCQLWFEKNSPEDKEPFKHNFLINMLFGGIIEAVFKGVLRAAGVPFKDNDKVTLDLGNGTKVKGEYDLVLDNRVDDVKSTTPYGYEKKFSSFYDLSSSDDFGYVSQLAGYATASGHEVGGWWIINKQDGRYKYLSATEEMDVPAELEKMRATADYLNNDMPFERCFEPVPETFSRKLTGNVVLHKTCGFCSYKKKCWPELQIRDSLLSKAKVKPVAYYIEINSHKEAA
tara:strand:- start:8 stop:877 length:870 start_codon:yes stop_codon:yes gene_type:complete